MDVKDLARFCRPIIVNVNKIMEIVELNRYLSSYPIAQELNITKETVYKHLLKQRLLHIKSLAQG